MPETGMPPASSPFPHANTAQLRDAIDRGRTGSKVPFPDPAAAPLGTDDEAAGTPPAAATVTQTLRRETASTAAHHGSANASYTRTRPRDAGRRLPAALIFALLLLLALTALIYFLAQAA